MEQQLHLVAARLRGLREIAGISATTLASELHLPAETYERYERGEADIPVSVLYQVAHRFGVELAELLTGDAPRLHTYSLVRAGKGLRVERRQAYEYQQLAYNFAHKKAEPFLVTVAPSATPPELNAHPGQELTYLLQGTLKVVVGGHELVLEEGDTLFFDAGEPHGMQALGDAPAQFLAVVM